MAAKILHIGCGTKKYPGAIGVDVVKLPNVDVVHDLDKLPYPFKSNTFDGIIADNILEHLGTDLMKVMAELHRICKAGAVIRVRVPNTPSVSAWADPTHKKFFTWFTFDYFGTNEYSFYSKVRLKILKKQFHFDAGRLYGIIMKPFEIFANLFPDWYAHLLSGAIPCPTLYFELEVVKEPKAQSKKA